MEIPKLNKIIYVEDDPVIQEVVAMSLQDIGGFDIRVYNSGQEALINIQDYNPDLFLIDLMMPILDGISLLEEIRKRPEFKNNPAIFITSKIHSDEIYRRQELGIIGVIAKPFDPITLPDTIRNLWEHYHSERMAG